ncbi:predicted protein [Histoplasma capsulatum H143]|uniref:Uncharacterized protein n=1 Tax=Ajellomyces capsulatus (strain H143) TaxID=544712 RepID=C6HCH5_AJECH|nr:predicted protein [Histoplasma capsulatum H143]
MQIADNIENTNIKGSTCSLYPRLPRRRRLWTPAHRALLASPPGACHEGPLLLDSKFVTSMLRTIVLTNSHQLTCIDLHIRQTKLSMQDGYIKELICRLLNFTMAYMFETDDTFSQIRSSRSAVSIGKKILNHMRGAVLRFSGAVLRFLALRGKNPATTRNYLLTPPAIEHGGSQRLQPEKVPDVVGDWRQ